MGQRKGLRIGTPAPDGRPRYVLGISPVERTVTVGPKESLAITGIDAIRPTWTGAPVTGEWHGHVQVRAHGEPLAARVGRTPERLRITLAEPATGIAPGQGVVLYSGDRVIGSGTIAATRSVQAQSTPQTGQACTDGAA